MSWTIKQAADQHGRTAIVTGANIGLGFETARALAGKGMHVVLACRNLAKADKARAAILAEYPQAQLETRALDLASLASVRAFAKSFIASAVAARIGANRPRDRDCPARRRGHITAATMMLARHDA